MFRGALRVFLHLALRLVEQACVLERDAHARSQRLQQAQVGVAERAEAIEILDADVTGHGPTGEQRREDHRLR